MKSPSQTQAPRLTSPSNARHQSSALVQLALFLAAAFMALGSSHAAAQDRALASNAFNPSRAAPFAGGIAESLSLESAGEDVDLTSTHRRRVGLLSMGTILTLGGLGSGIGSLVIKDDGVRDPNIAFVVFNFVTVAGGLAALIHSALRLRRMDVSLDVRRRHRRRIIPAAFLIAAAYAGLSFMTFFGANIDAFSS